eukprot:TRINITY_DN20012_c0_g1_i1.p1 TRINITY_DN20012_c0_g1~~TRINITY_DN20012_c0_g1_i1.p1  ORF type:complete len:114 (+),score=19.37 TRINITY_DN20012_c0_g1_i1:210-551(+)
MKLRQVFEAYSTQVDMLGICWMNREGLRSFAEDAYLGTTDQELGCDDLDQLTRDQENKKVAESSMTYTDFVVWLVNDAVNSGQNVTSNHFFATHIDPLVFACNDSGVRLVRST